MAVGTLVTYVWRVFFFTRKTRAMLYEVSRLTEENLAGVEPEQRNRNLDRIAEITAHLRKMKV